MKVKVTNLLLLVGAFVVAGIASGTGISSYDGSDLSSLLIAISLGLFVTTAAYLWSLGTIREQRAEWDRLVEMLNGECSIWSASVHGTTKGIPVHVRVESQNSNAEYLDRTCAMYSDAKHFFALTVTLPYKGQVPWRVLYKPKTATQPHGEWHAVCENSNPLSEDLEAAGLADLFSEWDKFTVVKCDAERGEITLRYPAPHKLFCPTVQEVENEINLLRRVGAIWQHAAHQQITV